MLNMVQTTVSVSIKNYLRAVAEKDLEMVKHLYSLYQKGEFTEAQARQLAESLLLEPAHRHHRLYRPVSPAMGSWWSTRKRNGSARTSTSMRSSSRCAKSDRGISNMTGKIPVRPGPHQSHVHGLFRTLGLDHCCHHLPQGVPDPGENRRFQGQCPVFAFSQSGYAFVTDNKGNVIIHPSLQGVNVIEEKEFSNYPLDAMLKEKSGKIVYPWQNPGERHMRDKLVLFNYLPEYEWIVASSSYLDEFYAPLDKLSNVIIFTVLGCILLVLPITALISASITNPLAELVKRLEQGARGDLSVRLKERSKDEVGRLAWYFNSFMDRLEENSRSLEAEVKERKEAEVALRFSENRYRSVIEAMPDAMVVYDMEGRVTYLNPAFTDVFGWTKDECMGRKLDHFVPKENWEETFRGLKTITSGKTLSSVETRRLTKSGQIIDVSTRGAVYRNPDGRQVGSVIIHRDVSDLKRLEKQVMDIGDRERQKIGQDLHDDLCPHLIGVEGLGKVLVRKLSERSRNRRDWRKK
jgi:PAS domain S-box-containing protein